MTNCLITTPIYYVNSAPHIGHAYTNIVASCIAEWKKLQSYDAFLLTGTDEHGQKIETSAQNANMQTQDFVDKYALIFKNLADFLQINYDDFIRTTEDRHKIVVQYIWRKLEENGYIYLGVYEGWYSIRDEAFYNESELIDGKAPTGADVKWHKEESYFFKLSDFQEKLLNFVKDGLNDLSISRTSFKWGIDVPNNKNHIVYVWIDALTNYISALGFSTEHDEKYKKYWQNGEKIHVIGKDILRFHAIYWPAILMATDLPLPDHLIAHGWWLKDGEKISKSLGNTIDPFELIEKFNLDYFRYFFLTESGFHSDGNYVESRFIEKINGELVNNFGNLLSRTTNMIVNYFEGEVKLEKTEIHDEFFEKKSNFITNFEKLMNEYKFHAAAGEIFKFSTMINQFIDMNKPWELFKKQEMKFLNDILYLSMNGLSVAITCLKPFIPQKIDEILKKLEMKIDFLNIKDNQEKFVVKEKINVFNRIGV